MLLPLVFSETPNEDLRLTARLPEPVTFYTLKKDAGITVIEASRIRLITLAGEYCLAIPLIPNVIGSEVGSGDRRRYIGDFTFEDANPPILIFPTEKEREWAMIYPVAVWDTDMRRLVEGKFDKQDALLREKAGALLAEIAGPRGNILRQVLQDSFKLTEDQVRMLEGQLKSALEVGQVIFRDGAESIKRGISLVPGEMRG